MAIIPGTRFRFWAGVAASIILGLVLVTAGVGKLPQPAETFDLLYALQIPITPVIADALSLSLTVIEVIIGLLLIIGVVGKLMAIFSALLTAAFIANNSWLLSQGLGHESCGCFGVLETVFVGDLSTQAALYIDIGMIVLALIIIFVYPDRFLNIRPWFLRIRDTVNRTAS